VDPFFSGQDNYDQLVKITEVSLKNRGSTLIADHHALRVQKIVHLSGTEHFNASFINNNPLLYYTSPTFRCQVLGTAVYAWPYVTYRIRVQTLLDVAGSP